MAIEQAVAPAVLTRTPSRAVDRRRLDLLLLVVLLLTAAVVDLNVMWLITHRSDSELFTKWLLSEYWLNYEHGFSRRGLPGQVLSWIVGGTPTYLQARAAGLMLSAAAALAITGLALSLIRRHQPFTMLAAAIVFTSPFAVPLVVHDLLRYDAVGMIVLFLLANGFIWRRITSPLTTGLVVSGLMLLATASEEFLAAYLLPVALIRVLLACRRGEDRNRREWLRPRKGEWAAVLVSLAPSLALLLASEAVRPSKPVIAGAMHGAVANGVLTGSAGEYSAISVLSNGLGQEARLVLDLGLREILPWLAVLVLLYLMSVAVIRQLLPTIASGPYWACAGWAGAVAFALCWVGVDYRRWWGLAFLTVAAAAVLLQDAHRAAPQMPRPRRRPQVTILAGVALLVIALPASTGIPIFLS